MSKVIPTDLYLNKCECGNSVAMKLYFVTPEDVSLKDLTREELKKGQQMLGVCECGNIFKVPDNLVNQ